MANVYEPEFDEPRERAGFGSSRSRVGRQVGSKRLGVSLWEIPPDEAAYPYHFHLVEEELIVILSGRAALRSPGGWRELAAGEVVSFPAGEEGGHQIANRGEEPVRMLAVSTNGEPDVVIYPDSGKIGAFERLPQGGGLYKLFRLEDEVDYWEGEEPPPSSKET